MAAELHVSDGAQQQGSIDRAVALALHVLSQSSAGIVASVPSSQRTRWPLVLLAPALGVRDRVRLYGDGESEKGATEEVVVLDPHVLPAPAQLLEALGGSAPPPTIGQELAGARAAIVTNIPIHYRVALFNELQEILAGCGARLRIFFLSEIPNDRSWIAPGPMSFDHTFLNSIDLGRAANGRHLLPKHLREPIRAFAPTVLLVAGFAPWVAMRLLGPWRGQRRPAIGIWSGEIPTRGTANSKPRAIQRRLLLKRADFGLAYGWESANYLNGLDSGLPVVIARNTTITVLRQSAASAHDTKQVEVITVGRAERGKALDLLIDAALELRDLPWRLTIVGDGPELPALKVRAAGLQSVRFLGALRPAAVAEELERSDVFLFPSQYDIFGLALVEAMAAGLAVVTSSRPGAVSDLCASGCNCLVVDAATPQAWSSAIRQVVSNRELRLRLGSRAQATINGRWTLAHSAAAMATGFAVGLRAKAGMSERTS